MAALATRLINKFPTASVFHVEVKTLDETSWETVDDGAPTEAVTISAPQGPDDQLVDGESWRVGDRVSYVDSAAISFVPLSGMQVDFHGESWRLVGVKSYPTSEPVAAYRLQLRR